MKILNAIKEISLYAIFKIFAACLCFVILLYIVLRCARRLFAKDKDDADEYTSVGINSFVSEFENLNSRADQHKEKLKDLKSRLDRAKSKRGND